MTPQLHDPRRNGLTTTVLYIGLTALLLGSVLMMKWIEAMRFLARLIPDL